MRYFIGFLIEGEAGTWHEALTRDISERFGTRKLHERVVPHITLYRPFDADDIAPVKTLLQSWTKQEHAPGTITLSGFGHFTDRVVYASVTLEAKAQQNILALRREIMTLLPKEDFPNWVPHATLADEYETPEIITEVWEYVQTLPKPEFTVPFNNVTLFRNRAGGGWDVDEIFQILH